MRVVTTLGETMLFLDNLLCSRGTGSLDVARNGRLCTGACLAFLQEAKVAAVHDQGTLSSGVAKPDCNAVFADLKSCFVVRQHE